MSKSVKNTADFAPMWVRARSKWAVRSDAGFEVQFISTT
jgi:hypothetical protein